MMLTQYRCLAAALSGALAVFSLGCSNPSSCSRDPDLVTVPLKAGMVDGNTYASAPFGGPYQHFPPFRTLSFEHGLGVLPNDVQFWLAFTPNGTLAPSAGNMTELKNGEDGGAGLSDTTISVYNNTCSEFYLWVVAERPTGVTLPDDGSAGAAGAPDESAGAGGSQP